MLTDGYRRKAWAVSVAPIVKTATVTGSAIDTANVGSVSVVFECGVLTDGTFTPSLTECATSGGTYTAVAAADMVGTLAAMASGTMQAVGYIGSKRYLKPVITVTGSPATGAVVAVHAVTDHNRFQVGP